MMSRRWNDLVSQVLERGERIELLVDKTDRLNQTSFKFEKSSRQLKEVRAVAWCVRARGGACLSERCVHGCKRGGVPVL
jgi:hypothetical protein